MKYLATVVLLTGLSGCYSSVAVVDLVRRHPPSVILVSVQPDAGTVRIDTTYGSLPSDVVFSRLMPELHLLTEATATHAFPRDLPCSTLQARLASPHDSFSRGEVLQITTSPTLVYRGGPFARGLPLGNSPSPPESDELCTLALDYAETDPLPKPRALEFYRGGTRLHSIALPRELGASRYSRWGRMLAAPIIDAAGLIIVPTEIVVAFATRWTK